MTCYEYFDYLIKVLQGPKYVSYVRKEIKHFGVMSLHIYVKTVLYCSLLFYAAVIQFGVGI
jgi:hypothetical protein